MMYSRCRYSRARPPSAPIDVELSVCVSAQSPQHTPCIRDQSLCQLDARHCLVYDHHQGHAYMCVCVCV